MRRPSGDHTGPQSPLRLLIVLKGYGSCHVVAPVVTSTVRIRLCPSRKRLEYGFHAASATILLSGPHVGRPGSNRGVRSCRISPPATSAM